MRKEICSIKSLESPTACGGVIYLCHLRLGPLLFENERHLKRIVAALEPYHPVPRDLPEGLPFIWDETTLWQDTNFTLSTDLGEIELLAEVSGLGNYQDALASSIIIPLYEREVRVLSLEALIKSKRAAGRTKDLLVLPELEALLEGLEKTSE